MATEGNFSSFAIPAFQDWFDSSIHFLLTPSVPCSLMSRPGIIRHGFIFNLVMSEWFPFEIQSISASVHMQHAVQKNWQVLGIGYCWFSFEVDDYNWLGSKVRSFKVNLVTPVESKRDMAVRNLHSFQRNQCCLTPTKGLPSILSSERLYDTNNTCARWPCALFPETLCPGNLLRIWDHIFFRFSGMWSMLLCSDYCMYPGSLCVRIYSMLHLELESRNGWRWVFWVGLFVRVWNLVQEVK